MGIKCIRMFVFVKSLRNISTHTFDGRGKPEHAQENRSEMSHFVAVAFLFQSRCQTLTLY